MGHTDTLVEPHKGVVMASEAIGDIIEFWGFKRALGRIWTLLYLSEDALSAAEIGALLKLSAGAVSMSLNEMEHWGIVLRESRHGSRQFYYRAETRVWQMICRVIRQREIHQLERLTYTLRDAADMLAHSRSPGARFAAERLKRLLSLVEWGTEVFRLAFMDGGFEVSTLQKIGQIRQLFQRS